ncbi:MAG: hypothetical protein JXP34_11745, partial [Planctomycetes bacterium]|nr:hypothetical protein [Planctomycetota bacterium]
MARSNSRPNAPFAGLAGVVCLAAASYGAENAITIGHAEGVPGDTVRVPVRMSNDIGVCWIFLAWTYDPEVLAFVTPTIEETASETLPVDSFFYAEVAHGAGTAGTIFIFSQTDLTGSEDCRFFPPGEDVPIVWLRFRIRSSAPAGETAVCHAMDTILDCGNTCLITIDGGPLRAAYRNGGVTVCAYRGFRPPEPISCAQVGKGVELAWENLDAYDGIEVERDGVPVATLPAGTTEWTDPAAPLGLRVYRLTATKDGVRSTGVECEIEVLPVVDPPPTVAGDSYILRVADVLAEPGERGVRVPIRATTMDPILGVLICVVAPVEGLIPGTGYTFEGSLTETIGYDMVFADNEGDRVRVAIIHEGFPPYEGKEFPPSVDAPILSVLIDVPPEAQPGDAIPLSFGVCGQPGNLRMETDFTVPNGNGDGAVSVLPEYVSGAVWVAGSGVPSVGNLRFDPLTTAKGPQSVRLSWRNAGAYDAITVERNGQVVAELPGDAESFIDALEANRVYLYRLTSHREGRPS